MSASLVRAPTSNASGGLKHVGGYSVPMVSKRLCRLAFQEETTVHEFLSEALEMLFRMRQA